MFIVELDYVAGLSQIDAHMASHVAFLKRQYAAGRFLLSGRKIPRDGGIIVALAESRHELEKIMEEDPFVRHQLARIRIIEFRASQRAPSVDALLGPPPHNPR